MISQFSELSFLLQRVQNPHHHLNKEKLNWELILRVAKRNKITPFLSHLINCRGCQKKVPPTIIKKLNDRYRLLIFLGKLQEQEKKKINRLFHLNHIAAFPLKDYSDYKVRYPPGLFGEKYDLDYFLPQADITKINKIMENIGYHSYDYQNPKDKYALLERDYRKLVHGFPIFINLHFYRILPETSGKISPISQTVADNFTRAYLDSASPGLNLAFHCLHFFWRDDFTGLGTLYHLHLAASQLVKKIDWPAIINKLKELHLTNYFLFVLKIANLLFKTPLSSVIEREIKSSSQLAFALKIYFPILTILADSLKEKRQMKSKPELAAYRYFLKLLLWEKGWIRKLGPRTFWYFFLYFLPTYRQLSRWYNEV